MIKLGEIQVLTVLRSTDNGIYLSASGADTSVLLPKNQVTDEMTIGSEVSVFIYRDSEDRLIATTTIPKLTLGQVETLEVTDVTNIGAFLDWGLAKDLLLPFKEQKCELHVGDVIPVSLYIDKSSRLCATAKIYDYLSSDSPYSKGDTVEGTIFEINPNYGAFVAIDNKYHGLIPKNDYFGKLSYGNKVKARITSIREDGKINLSLRDSVTSQMDTDAELIMNKLIENNGYLPYGDKTSPDIIAQIFSISKKSYKRAIGKLYKEKKIIIKDDGIYIVK